MKRAESYTVHGYLANREVNQFFFIPLVRAYFHRLTNCCDRELESRNLENQLSLFTCLTGHTVGTM